MLREVQLNIGVKKIDTYESITVKALLNSSTIEMFIDQKMAVRYKFRLQKLERPVVVRNINRTNNSTKFITHQVKVNIYYKSHVERIRIDVCDLGRTNIILEILWLQVHNLEINWKIGKVKITRCPPLYEKNTKLKEEKRVVTLEEKKIVKQIVDDKENQKREEEVEVDYRKIKEMVPQKFLK